MNGGNNKNGPCGACKFLRRKCLKGCIFAPYFDQEQGTAHFAAVHRVFGASSASKMLMRVPAHKRLDVVVTLCYEALARVRDPVYGCVAHLFTLQQQVVNMQAELACAHARLSTLQRLPSMLLPATQSTSPTNFQHCSSNASLHNLEHSLPSEQTSMDMVGFSNSEDDQDFEDGDDLLVLAQGFDCRYLPGVEIKPSTSP